VSKPKVVATYFREGVRLSKLLQEHHPRGEKPHLIMDVKLHTTVS
jgi:hypothetical protein